MFQQFYSFFTHYTDILTPVLTGIFTLLLFMAKEFWENRRARREERKAQLDVFGIYGYPLLTASKELVDRLFDILLEKPRYLHRDAPQTEYYKYHYISTLYRMCSVLGWIRAIRRELSRLEVGRSEINQNLEDAIRDFQSALASNCFMEGEQINYLVERWGLKVENGAGNLESLSNEEKNKLERGFEELVASYMKGKEVNHPMDLQKDEKLELLRKVRDNIAEALGHTEPFEEDLLSKYVSSCLRVITRRVSWIYKDWQRGIGDFMLRERDSETAIRRLELKSFQKFEDEFQEYQEGKAEHRWIRRVDQLFHDLQPGSSILYDVRDQQLEEVSGKLVALISTLRKAGIGSEKIKEEELEALRDKRDRLEARKEEEARKKEAAQPV